MRNLLLVLLMSLFVNLSVSAQTAESDSLYAIGVSLYEQGKYEEAIPYFYSIDSIWAIKGNKLLQSKVKTWLSSCFCEIGDYSEAICLGSEALKIREKVLGKEHPDYATSLSNLAICYADLGNYSEAIRMGTEALEIREKVLGKEHPDYANSLGNLATYNYNIGNYSVSIRLETEALNIIEKVLGKEHPDYATSLSNLANYNSALGNFSEAIRLGTEALKIRKKVLGKEHPGYAISLSNVASYNSAIGNYSEAIRLGNEALKIHEEVFGKEHPYYATSLSDLANYNSDLSNYSEAIRLETEALEILEKVFGKKHPDYATSLSNLARYLSFLGNYSEAIRMGTEVLEILEKVFGKKHPDYAISLSNVASYNSIIGNYSEAIRLGTEALEILEKVLGKEHPQYALCLNRLANYNANLGNYSEAMRLGTEALRIREKVLGKEHPDYAMSLNNLANYESSLGNYSESIRLCTEALHIYENVFGKEHPNYATSLGNLAGYHSHLGNYSEAMRLGTEVLGIHENILGKEHPDYAISLNNLATCNSAIGNYPEAIRLGTKVLHIYKKVFGKKHPKYVTCLSNLATYNADLGNYFEAIRLGTEALEICEKVLGKKHPRYVNNLSNLADYNAGIGNYSEAIRLGSEALMLKEKVLGKKHPSYVNSLSNLATYNSDLDNYSEAIRLGTEALKIREKVLGKEHPDYAISLSNLATYNADLDNYSEAIRLGTEALKIREKVLGKEHPDYSMELSNLSSYYLLNNNYQDMFKCLAEIYQIEQKNIKKQFVLMTSVEQHCYSSELDSKYIKNDAFIAKDISELQKVNYDALLLNKNINLNYLRDRQDIIAESGDSALIKLYNDIKLNNMILTNQLEKPIKQRFLNTDSLYNVIQQQERELALKSREYGDFMKSLSITHKDIKSKLEKDDIAIEFVEAQLPGSDTIVYYALTLRNDYDAPRLIPLFNKKDFDEQVSPGSTHDSSFTKFVWAPLSEELKGVKNIYFSPSGILYKLNIENLPSIDGNGIMSDKYNMFRLSSTRELALDRANKGNMDAVVYGGIQYSADEANVSVLEANARLYASINRSDENIYNPYIDSIGVNRDDRKDPNKGRYLPSLPNAKVEANAITKTINDAHIKDFTATVFTDTAATEASFKALSGQKKRLIHIATHGFYYKEADSLKYKDIMPQMFLDERNKHRYVEDKQLTRSGLYFAGADNRRLGKKIPEGVDDGILTAQEISMLDLRGCDLVVLSACQTAQGDIGADGVFGLQRAFKKAGVNSILMSIDKIDDRATQMLMTEFYKNYVKGVSKQESLKRAQKYLREEIEYKDAKYWSSFILLDALD